MKVRYLIPCCSRDVFSFAYPFLQALRLKLSRTCKAHSSITVEKPFQIISSLLFAFSFLISYVHLLPLRHHENYILYRPIMERRDLLVKNVKEIKGHIMLSEMTHVTVSLLLILQ